jgi:hypothetical protein
MSRADFIQMTTASIAGTGGNGAVTMSQVTTPVNSPTFTQVFGASARLVDYTIIDSVAGKWEKGYGAVAANVLTRSTIHETYDGTTWNNTSATALAFGASPNAGNVVIRLAPTADAFMPVPPAINRTIGSDGFLGYQLSAHTTAFGGQSSNPLSASVEYYAPFLLLVRGKVDGVCISITSAGTLGNSVKLGLYEVGTDGLPGPPITLFNAIPVASTGLITDTTAATWSVNAGPLRLTPGWYYLGLMTNDTSFRFECDSGSAQQIAYNPTGRQGGYGFGTGLSKAAQNSYATGLPSSTPTIAGGGYSLFQGSPFLTPHIGLRINN